MYAKYMQDKYSAVAEMGDRLAAIDTGRRKLGDLPPPALFVRGSWVLI